MPVNDFVKSEIVDLKRDSKTDRYEKTEIDR